MTAKKIRTLLASALVLGAVVLGSTGAAPAGADPSDIDLEINHMSPQYRAGDCVYKIIYGNYGSAPYAGVRVYNTLCFGSAVVVKSADGNGIHYTSSQTVAHNGIDSCGAYWTIQATGPNPGYGIGARFHPADGGTLRYASDGTSSQPVYSTC
jgi:hypothetical protein